MADLTEMDLDQLQEAYNALEAERDGITAQMQVYGLEMNQRRTEATAATFMAGIGEGLEPAIIKLATQRLAAEPIAVQTEAVE
jgi:hypothetical protein